MATGFSGGCTHRQSREPSSSQRESQPKFKLRSKPTKGKAIPVFRVGCYAQRLASSSIGSDADSLPDPRRVSAICSHRPVEKEKDCKGSKRHED